MAVIMDGKLVSTHIRSELKTEIESLKSVGVYPKLAVVLVGQDPASQVYVKNKHKACLDLGIEPVQINMPFETEEAELLAKIDELNADKSVNGILVQLPLPKHISEDSVIDRISPKKDVDAFTRENVGKIVSGKYGFLPCTPAGIMEILKYYNVEIEGKRCVVVGRSNIVGKPMMLLLLAANGTVTVAHSKTRDLKSLCREADILVAAVGKPKFIGKDMVKDGAVIVDVGINRLSDGTLVGDVDFASVENTASYITPVPGGVGPMTITMLMKNTVAAAKEQNICQ